MHAETAETIVNLNVMKKKKSVQLETDGRLSFYC